MTTHTASIFVELEIRVSGTLTRGCPESHDPPSPAEPGGWEDVTVEGISHTALRWRDGTLKTLPFDLLNDWQEGARWGKPGHIEHLTRNLIAEFSEEIEAALTDAVPDGPDPDDRRDAAADRRLSEGV